MEKLDHTDHKGYSYYCTHCGEKLSGEKVLFDMQELLLADSGSEAFRILKFRITAAELEELYNSGTPQPDNTRECTLTMGKLMEYIGNKNNMDVPEAVELTMEQLGSWADQVEAEFEKSFQRQSENLVDLINDNVFFGLFQPCGESEEIREDPEIHPVIRRLLEKGENWNTTTEPVDMLLFRDVRLLQNAFGQSSFSTTLDLIREQDDQGREVLCGIRFRVNGVWKEKYNRICPRCEKPVFRYAGTVPQKNVTVLGTRKDEHVSLMTALAEYARCGMVFNFGSPVWAGVPDLAGYVTSVQVLEEPCMQRYREQFNQGLRTGHLCPVHDRRGYPCNVTFRVVDRENHTNLITLWAQNLWDYHHSQFRDSDALVLCIDYENQEQTGADQVPWWDSYMGKLPDCLRDYLRNYRVYVDADAGCCPILRVYTRCRELEESGVTVEMPRSPWRWPYLLNQEQRIIGADKALHDMEYGFSRMENYLGTGYRAVMRCSAYGHRPMRYRPYDGPDGLPPDRPPRPKNIHLLMQWLLAVTGCIPVDVTVGFGEDQETVTCRARRRQLRGENPMTEGNFREEALLRRYLFENPSELDQSVSEAESVWVQMSLRLRMKYDSKRKNN